MEQSLDNQKQKKTIETATEEKQQQEELEQSQASISNQGDVEQLELVNNEQVWLSEVLPRPGLRVAAGASQAVASCRQRQQGDMSNCCNFLELFRRHMHYKSKGVPLSALELIHMHDYDREWRHMEQTLSSSKLNAFRKQQDSSTQTDSKLSVQQNDRKESLKVDEKSEPKECQRVEDTPTTSMPGCAYQQDQLGYPTMQPETRQYVQQQRIFGGYQSTSAPVDSVLQLQQQPPQKPCQQSWPSNQMHQHQLNINTPTAAVHHQMCSGCHTTPMSMHCNCSCNCECCQQFARFAHAQPCAMNAATLQSETPQLVYGQCYQRSMAYDYYAPDGCHLCNRERFAPHLEWQNYNSGQQAYGNKSSKFVRCEAVPANAAIGYQMPHNWPHYNAGQMQPQQRPLQQQQPQQQQQQRQQLKTQQFTERKENLMVTGQAIRSSPRPSPVRRTRCNKMPIYVASSYNSEQKEQELQQQQPLPKPHETIKNEAPLRPEAEPSLAKDCQVLYHRPRKAQPQEQHPKLQQQTAVKDNHHTYHYQHGCTVCESSEQSQELSDIIVLEKPKHLDSSCSLSDARSIDLRIFKVATPSICKDFNKCGGAGAKQTQPTRRDIGGEEQPEQPQEPLAAVPKKSCLKSSNNCSVASLSSRSDGDLFADSDTFYDSNDCSVTSSGHPPLVLNSLDTLADVWHKAVDSDVDKDAPPPGQGCLYANKEKLEFQPIDVMHAGFAGRPILDAMEQRTVAQRSAYFERQFDKLTHEQRKWNIELRMEQLRKFQDSSDFNYQRCLQKGDALRCQFVDTPGIETLPHPCPMDKVRCPLLLPYQLLAHFVTNHLCEPEMELREVYDRDRLLVIFNPPALDVGQNICMSLIVYGGMRGRWNTLPALRYMPVCNAGLPDTYCCYAGHLPLLVMACRTKLSALSQKHVCFEDQQKRKLVRDEDVLALWVVSMPLTQPVHVLMTVFNRRMDVTRSGIMQVRSLNRSHNCNEFMRYSRHYMRLSEQDMRLLTNDFKEPLYMELSVREYTAEPAETAAKPEPPQPQPQP